MQRLLALTSPWRARPVAIAPIRTAIRSLPPRVALALICLLAGGPGDAALAQKKGGPPAGPPPVGVAQVRQSAVTSSSQYIGRIQAVDRVALVPRVTAYLDKRLFDEGSEVKQGQLLYVLEQGPFQAQVLAQQGTLAQAQANVANAKVNFQRQVQLLRTPAGQKQAYDNAQETAQSGAASVLTAEGNLQAAQIQLGYTEIRAPVNGRITSTAVNQGNVVSPSSGTLATIVTQDPMYVVFPIASRDLLTLQKKYQAEGGLEHAVIELTLGDGSRYDHDATPDYVAPTVSEQTDTITLRATVPNPTRGAGTSAGVSSRELVDGEFVTVTVADPHPVEQVVVPTAAVLSDQQGNYVFGLGPHNEAVRIDIKQGETTGTNSVVLSGLRAGQTIIVDGIQKVHAGGAVSPGPPQAAPADPEAAATRAAAGPQPGQGGTGGGTGAATTQGAPSPPASTDPSQR